MNSVAMQFIRALIDSARRRFLLALALMVTFSATEGFGILLILPTLQAAGLDLAGQGIAGRYAEVIGRVFHAVGVRPSLGILLALLVILIGFRAVLGNLQSVAIFSVEQEFTLSLRLRLYHAIANANWLFISRSRAADFTHALTAELDRVAQASYVMMLLASDGVLSVLYCAIALRLSASMTLLVLACGAALAIALRGRTRAIEDAGQEQSSSGAGLYAAIIEHLQSLKTIKAYAAEERNFAIFARSGRAVIDANLAAAGVQAATTAWFELGSATIMGIVLYFAVRILAVPSAAILVLLVLFARILPRLMALHQHWRSFIGLLPAFANVVAMEARCVEAAESITAGQSAPELRRELRFERVSFSYRRGDIPAVCAADLAVPAGAIVALVGASGGGKSTLADLAMGLIVPDHGVVSIDGVALTGGAARRWREQVGYVGHDTFLFHDTIRANLQWAQPNASEDTMREALAIANAEEFINGLPSGLDTVIGDRGLTLSHGERQRIALARAWLRRPRLLVLDEATNHLDSASETRVLDALSRVRETTAVLLIAHRIATVRWADQIYVIEGGRVVEYGDWNALSARPHGRFRAMREAQELGS